MLETIAGLDETLFDLYCNEETISAEAIIAAVQRLTKQRAVVPVLCGSAFKRLGCQPLLDAVVQYLSSPNERNTIEVEEGEAIIQLETNVEATPMAVAFKIVQDKFKGKLVMARLFAGKLEKGMSILNTRTDATMRISKLFKIHANTTEETTQVEAGDIFAFTGAKNAFIGDVFCDTNRQLKINALEIPAPVLSVAVEPKSSADLKLFASALANLQSVDPTFKVQYNAQTGQTVVTGMGELHLEMILEKLELDHGLNINKGAPEVTYKERITKSVRHRERLKKQTGGSGEFAEIEFIMSPLDTGETGLEFVNSIVGGAIPQAFIPSVKKGFEQCLQEGLLGYPVVGMRVELLDGAIHREDSSAADFEKVAKLAFRKVYMQARPQLMEPCMVADVSCPAEFTGSVTSDLNRRRGVLKAMEIKGQQQQIVAEVPLQNLFGYVSTLRTLTSGRGYVSMAFSHYADAPKQAQAVLV